MLSLLLLSVVSIECAVLDPALYLLPSPPISRDQPSEWLKSARALEPVEDTPKVEIVKEEEATEQPDLEASETFWPGLRSIKREVHIPLTFQLTGSYGNFGGYGTGVIGNTYAGISGITGLLGRGKSALAGSSYGSYYDDGVKIYGGNRAPAWGGWGNGRWGHYGKG
ncbi:uncharacterized protein LOC121737146 [Aricia agestis]|uniref:uncharacterized protein LOC121737146 n=1 Tax=Aricia agestis TaxID=91739 RepID=UPI001C20BA11|nr:uncharacterized protein LOC121737146 [Aricia agestis]